MNNPKTQKTILGAAALVLIILIAFCVELLGFRGALLRLPEEQKGMHIISDSELILQDLVLDDEGILRITGDAPSFALPGDGYVGRLHLETVREAVPMHVTPSVSGKSHDVSFAFKPVTVIDVGAYADEVSFAIAMDNAETDGIMIASLTVDNTVQLNWLRVLFMVSVGAAAWFFLFFGKTAARRLHVTFAVLAVVLGVNLSLMIPTWYAYDEYAHFVRAYQFSQFNLGFDHEEELDWIEDVDGFFAFTGTVNAPFQNYTERVSYVERFSVNDYPVSEYIPTTAATYPFVPYTFAGLGILLARLIGLPFIYTFYAGRLLNLLGYVLICAFAIRFAKIGKRLLFLLALFPYALFSASVYTADTMTIALSLLSMAVFLNMLLSEDGSLDWKLPGVFGLCVGLMALCKLPYAAFCMLILAVPLKKHLSKKFAIIHFGLVVGLVGVISVATLLYGADKGIIQWYEPGMSITGQVKYILTHPFDYAWLMVSQFVDEWKVYLSDSIVNLAYCGRMHGVWVVIALAAVALTAVFDGEEQAKVLTPWAKLLCIGGAVCAWVLVLTALYVSYNVVGRNYIGGVQGRYFFPLLLPLLLLLKNGRVKSPLKAETMNLLCGGTMSLMGVAAVWSVCSGFCM